MSYSSASVGQRVGACPRNHQVRSSEVRDRKSRPRPRISFVNGTPGFSRSWEHKGNDWRFSLFAVAEERRHSLHDDGCDDEEQPFQTLLPLREDCDTKLAWCDVEGDPAGLGCAMRALVSSVLAAGDAEVDDPATRQRVFAAIEDVKNASGAVSYLAEGLYPDWEDLAEGCQAAASSDHLEAAAQELLGLAKVVPRELTANGALQALSHLLALPDPRNTLRHTFAAAAARILFGSEPKAAPQSFVASEGIPALVKILESNDGAAESPEQTQLQDLSMDLLCTLLLAEGQPPKVRSRRAARALCAGAVPVLLRLMSQKRRGGLGYGGAEEDEEEDVGSCAAVGPADVLGLIIQAPECAELIIQHRLVGGLVSIINDPAAEPAARSRSLRLLGCVACTGDQNLHRAVAITAAWPLARALGHGTEEEVEAAEATILEVAGSPTGAKYLQQAGLVAAITAPFGDPQAVRSQREMERGIRLTACLLSCHDAIEGLMQPAMMDMFNYFLMAGSSRTKLSACETLGSLLSECGGATASRARRLIPRLVQTLRAAEDKQLRRATSSCLERLSKERGLKEVVVTSGAAGAVMDLLEDGSDEFSSSHGLALVQNLSVGYPMFSKDLIRRGVLELIVPHLTSDLSLQAVAALGCISASFDISAYLIVHGALEPLAALIQQQQAPPATAPASFEAGSREQQLRLETLHVLMRMNYENRRQGSAEDERSQEDMWRRKFLAGYLLARTLTSTQAEGNVPISVCNAIPALVMMLGDTSRENLYAPSYATDYIVFSQRLRRTQYSRKTLSEIPRAALAALVRHFPGCRWTILESLALRTWQGHREGDPWLDDVLQEP